MATTDIREAVLARLPLIALTIDGVLTAGRNIKRPSDDRLPAIIVLDADEEAEREDSSRRPGTPRRMVMTPEIYLIAQERAENVGPEINALRALYLRAVLLDEELVAILGANGEMRYMGCATGLSEGRGMVGEMGLNIGFYYVLQPLRLLPLAS